MSKLTKLATAAIAAMALIAVSAPAANADRAFGMAYPNGDHCDWFSPDYCEDTGYSGTFNIGSAQCSASFDVRFEWTGAIETYNTNATCIQGYSLQVAWECDGLPWTGQVRLPDTGPAQVDLDACLTYYPYNSDYHHQITVQVTNNPRRWQQLGTGTTGAPMPITNGYFTDNYQDDNVIAILL